MDDNKIIVNCHTCSYLSKKSGLGQYFIYTCTKWGLVTKRIIPYATVANSIGELCPFYIQKKFNTSKDHQKKSDGLDIII
ncbi:MAG: hypothetical protein A2015_03770 [Spirochaetes bacterium GWF1_31_7]|nr:MAG: hypothetical protein A2Y30_06315 [Spirochaetes bacterium GWE1_32_154]OHD48828.1 MAG: hypothetical protein A2015_03770 [Spirochaetes bacterium GWF1_31_7]OHD48861.1 MAG: hypothetical protein A2Y29_05220 [Spirochaetes bacterium GWE2_31_10]OHD73048.1 MAG: hypothetical protein A2355_14005 [Spirochaetes bacterium RIFOXYB1_FULL_32_8]HBD92644.1 hypothetical protein [Spirochaetia bacterium]